jgi:hypothetical protein
MSYHKAARAAAETVFGDLLGEWLPSARSRVQASLTPYELRNAPPYYVLAMMEAAQ